jgi:hypothetical protein
VDVLIYQYWKLGNDCFATVEHVGSGVVLFSIWKCVSIFYPGCVFVNFGQPIFRGNYDKILVGLLLKWGPSGSFQMLRDGSWHIPLEKNQAKTTKIPWNWQENTAITHQCEESTRNLKKFGRFWPKSGLGGLRAILGFLGERERAKVREKEKNLGFLKISRVGDRSPNVPSFFVPLC